MIGPSNTSLNRSTSTQVLPSSTTVPPPNLVPLPVLGQVSDTVGAKDASTPAISQVPPSINARQPEIDPNIDDTDSMESFVNLDPLLALAVTQQPAGDHHRRLAIAKANKVQNFRL
uniref:Uncharacterized protein n=1 Tax=Romanomermis culicivorax TaxID=13658 RepID=A0A915K2R6_ROMCU